MQGFGFARQSSNRKCFLLAISDLKMAEVQEDDSSKQKKKLQTRVKPALNRHINKLHLK